MITVEFTATTPILDAARRSVPAMTIGLEAERSSPGGAVGTRLLFWATGGDVTAFERALEADPTVTEPRVLEDTGRRRLYRVIVTEDGMAHTSQPLRVELDGTIQLAESTDDEWFVRMRFPDRSAVAEFRSWFAERDRQFRITSLHESTGAPRSAFGGQLTDRQRETIVCAYDAGYFDVPRGATLVDLAETLGVSDTAVSQRLRRALASIVGSEIRQVRDPD